METQYYTLIEKQEKGDDDTNYGKRISKYRIDNSRTLCIEFDLRIQLQNPENKQQRRQNI